MFTVLGNGEELRHLDFRKIGVNYRCVRKRTFKHNECRWHQYILLQVSYHRTNMSKCQFVNLAGQFVNLAECHK